MVVTCDSTCEAPFSYERRAKSTERRRKAENQRLIEEKKKEGTALLPLDFSRPSLSFFPLLIVILFLNRFGKTMRL